MIIFPAIDILDKQCVRLTQGDYGQKTMYADNPIEIAKSFQQKGAEYVHVVDLNAAKSGSLENFEIISEMAKQLSIPIQVGGGVRNDEAVERYLKNDVQRVIIGTAAVTNQEWLTELCRKYPNRICLSLDVKNEEILIKGWTAGSSKNIFDYLKDVADLQLAAIVVTDISKDGMLQGPGYSLYEKLLKATAHPIIASGGVSTTDDIRKLREMGLYGAIIGKALYENKITLEEVLK